MNAPPLERPAGGDPHGLRGAPVLQGALLKGP